MRIQRQGGQVTLHDRPAAFWFLGLFLLTGGLLALAMPLGLARNAGELEPWERIASVALGLSVCAGAVWWLAKNPASKVHLDLTRRSLRLVRWGLVGRQVRQLTFDKLEGTLVEHGEDSEGGRIWRPAVRLRSGEIVLLSELWSHDEADVRTAVATVAEVCRLHTS